MKLRTISVFLFIIAIAAGAFAASATATLSVSGTVASSVSVSLATGTGGATLGGTPTAATLSLGTFGRSSTISNWTRDTSSATSYAFSTPVNVTIDGANTTSTAATVTAYLTSSVTGVTYSFGGTDVVSTNSGSPTTIAGTTYTLDSNKNYTGDNTFKVTVADSVASGTDIANAINLTVTVN